ncbi:N-acetylglucosamine-6-phosphate deacetylase [Salipiger sp. IMCC34102]|uniref:N-acetylglucosamine-6-phosphate deacetylase n=1 Tax=Salipiger sp. IMCC34102 TaxID=2510647 RepID=UPI00101C8C36|nr:N-acetylglucosamine-6-phosphate deacetylase [Salipiger sp. IMCC34102]RYH04494.1 N-acetylglucosamine-6-phosphate deacetylase [Salipiger sp. IMCC34102]
MTMTTAYHAPRIFDGTEWHDEAALLVADGCVTGIVPRAEAPEGEVLEHPLVPGFVDLQVNGGGGVLFNNTPSTDGIAAICDAHARFGTTSTMVTLITDTAEVTGRAVAAARAARHPGFLGLHLEGPHLALSRKGTHDPALIRPMDPEDLQVLTDAAQGLDRMISTVAPETVTPAQIATLAKAGVVVSLGHSDCDMGVARAAADAGATMVTHLFNAMSQLGHRSPNLVGAALDDGRLWAGLIADGFHVDPTALRIALRAKAGPAGLFLVSDAMSTVGTDASELILNDRRILRKGGRLTLEDGTLAGADIALVDAVRYLHLTLGVALGEAVTLASAAPAAAMGLSDRGHLRPGARADFTCLTPGIEAVGTWIAGRRADAAA